jgi:hypothetical protein
MSAVAVLCKCERRASVEMLGLTIAILTFLSVVLAFIVNAMQLYKEYREQKDSKPIQPRHRS